VDAVAHLVEAGTPGFDLVAFAHEQQMDHPTLRRVLTMNTAAGTPGIRIEDLINRGGEKISAEEVEFLLLQHPAVTAAAVVAMPDERLGERTCAYLVPSGEPLTMEDIRGHLTALGVAKFKWPERLEWLPELPKTPVGKLDKKRLQTDVAAKVAAEQAATA
jgi:2,3-dihydroxybenzoate-AMP ligase